MMTYSVGVVGSGLGAAEYRLAETLKPEAEARARYYAGEVPPPGETLADELGRSIVLGGTSYSSALDEFVRAKLALLEPRVLGISARFAALDPGRDFDPDEIKAQAGAELPAAIDRDDASREIAKRGGTVAELRPDISPALAARLGIADPDRLLGTAEIASLLNGRRADGGEIEGKEIHKPRISIAAVFGIDTTQALTGRGMENVLAGKRVDGDAPRTEAGRALDQKVVDGAVNRFRQAMGVPAHRDATADEIAHLIAGRTAGGGIVDRGDFTRAMHGTRPPVGY